MTADRFQALTDQYRRQRIAVIGDFCLDRYWEIDPDRAETSLETGREVHNVVETRCQPGAAGTIVANLAALGIGHIDVVGFCGADGEGFELASSLEALPGVDLSRFIQTPKRQTFTYTKPLIKELGKAPVELNRFDIKNWSPTPNDLQEAILDRCSELMPELHAIILLDQVDLPDTGVVSQGVLDGLTRLLPDHNQLYVVGDSRRGLQHFPPVISKMNRNELARFLGSSEGLGSAEVRQSALKLAESRGKPVFVTIAEEGIVGATPQGEVAQIPACPLKGEIDVVGAGDAVTANLTAALAAGADLTETLQISQAAASVVLHQLGTTGAATPHEIHERLTQWTAGPLDARYPH